MRPSILIVAPDSRSLRRLLGRLSGRPFSWAYVGHDAGELGPAGRILEDQGTQLDTTQRLQQAAETLREPYLEYLYGIGRGLNTLRWWLTSLSHRNIHQSTTFRRACFVKFALDLVRTWESAQPLAVVVADKLVRRTLERNLALDGEVSVQVVGPRRSSPLQTVWDTVNMLAHRAHFVMREAYRLYQSRRLVRRPGGLAEPATLLVCSVSSRNIHLAPEFHRSFFGDLAVRLGESGRRVTVVPRILDDIQYKDALLRLRGASTPLLVPHRSLGFLDLVRAAVSSSTRPPLPRPVPALSGMDISPLVHDELRSDWCGNGAADELLTAALVRRWARLGNPRDNPIERIIYVYENLPWERALCWEAGRSLPGTVLVGYQHAAMPRLNLKFYLAAGGEPQAPLPNRVVTVGKHTAQLLSSDGHDPDKVRVGGALQLDSVLAERPLANARPPSPSPKQDVVLVAASVGQRETTDLVNMAAQLFDEDEGVGVVIKCHPKMPFNRVGGLLSGPLPKHVRVSDEPMSDLIPRSSLMVYTESTVCVQGLALGLPVLHLRPQYDFDLDPLEAAPDVRPEAMGLRDLREKVRWLLDHREEYVAQHRDRWKRLVDDMFGPVTEETVRAFVD